MPRDSSLQTALEEVRFKEDSSTFRGKKTVRTLDQFQWKTTLKGRREKCLALGIDDEPFGSDQDSSSLLYYQMLIIVLLRVIFVDEDVAQWAL